MTPVGKLSSCTDPRILRPAQLKSCTDHKKSSSSTSHVSKEISKKKSDHIFRDGFQATQVHEIVSKNSICLCMKS